MITPAEARARKRAQRRRALPDVGAYVGALQAGATRQQGREAQTVAVREIRHRAIAPWRSLWKAAPPMPAPKIEIQRIRPDARVYTAMREQGQGHAVALATAIQAGVRI